MTLERDIACLKQIPLFASLPAPRLKLVTLMGERLSFSAGTQIIAAGDTADGVFFVLQGEVTLSHEAANGKAEGFRFESGSVFGDVPMLCGQPYIGDVIAKTEVEVLRLPRDLFHELVQTIPEFALAVSQDLAGRLYRLANVVLHDGPALLDARAPA